MGAFFNRLDMGNKTIGLLNVRKKILNSTFQAFSDPHSWVAVVRQGPLKFWLWSLNEIQDGEQRLTLPCWSQIHYSNKGKTNKICLLMPSQPNRKFFNTSAHSESKRNESVFAPNILVHRHTHCTVHTHNHSPVQEWRPVKIMIKNLNDYRII